ncbi:esterase/lipase family protein [Corynebacterium hansenii]|uniref:Esterase/lipase family protein n=1 Tax=Corynebacterium hansenii TaxID=394964 RepID=A0ABV7ZSI3_9CORY|nr:alpha/beta fold hydrolase [Corynebacterium hansenii]WJZ00988.1 Lipase precursor [Corynebacterium hansenii]
MAEQTPQVPYATYRTRRGIFEDDWRASVSPKRPWPIVLIHGTGHAKGVWEDLGAELRKDGWAVFAPDYGYRATGPLTESMDQLAAYIRQVLVATGGRRAIIVGHSQGGLLATLLSFRDPQFTRHVVCLAAPNHGTSLGGVASGLLKIPGTKSLVNNFVQSYWGQSGIEQLTGSPLLEDIARRDVTAPGVTYTCLASRTDQLINPPSSCFLDDGGQGTVDNIWIQDRFPQAVVLHEHVATDRRVRALVREQLLRLVNESFSGAAFLAEGDDDGNGDGSSSDARADAMREELGDAPNEGANVTTFASLLSAVMYREGFSDWAERAGFADWAERTGFADWAERTGFTGLQQLAESMGPGTMFKWGRNGEDEAGSDEAGEDAAGDDEAGSDEAGEDAAGDDEAGDDAAGEAENGSGDGVVGGDRAEHGEARNDAVGDAGDDGADDEVPADGGGETGGAADDVTASHGVSASGNKGDVTDR